MRFITSFARCSTGEISFTCACPCAHRRKISSPTVMLDCLSIMIGQPPPQKRSTKSHEPTLLLLVLLPSPSPFGRGLGRGPGRETSFDPMLCSVSTTDNQKHFALSFSPSPLAPLPKGEGKRAAIFIGRSLTRQTVDQNRRPL